MPTDLTGRFQQLFLTWTCVAIAALFASPREQAVAASAATAPLPVVGRKIDDFTLVDHRGKRVSLSDFRDASAIVVAFLGTECPIVKLYAQRLQEMSDEYKDRGVVFLGVDSNQQDSLAEIEHFVRTHGIRFPVLKDPGNRVADSLGAQRTPDVYVLDDGQTVQYYGRIDDQYAYETQRPTVEQDYLKAALDQVLAGDSVSVPTTEVFGCHIGRMISEQVNRGVTYAGQICGILQRRCVECHREGEIAPFALTDYDEIVGWAEMIEEVVREQRMPPWHADPAQGKFANDRRMSEAEKQLLYQWIDDGAPMGDASRIPEPPRFTAGWQLPQRPDMVVPMRDEPFKVAARGVIRYQYFVVDPGLTEDRWVQAAEILPGNRKVVHHVLVFAKPAGSRGLSGERGGFLAAYVPGLRATPYPAGLAKKLPAGSQLVFQVHYTPVGTEQEDVSRLALIFAAPEDVTHEVETASAIQHKFAIPPHAENYQVEAVSRTSPGAVQLLTLMPHMHLRGKSFRYEARYANGSSEILLDVPRYDFNWQTSYRLLEPKRIPAGARIHCTAHFDNSEENLANPDPSQTVRWGEQTWDEMMIGYFDVAYPRRDLGR